MGIKCMQKSLQFRILNKILFNSLCGHPFPIIRQGGDPRTELKVAGSLFMSGERADDLKEKLAEHQKRRQQGRKRQRSRGTHLSSR